MPCPCYAMPPSEDTTYVDAGAENKRDVPHNRDLLWVADVGRAGPRKDEASPHERLTGGQQEAGEEAEAEPIRQPTRVPPSLPSWGSWRAPSCRKTSWCAPEARGSAQYGLAACYCEGCTHIEHQLVGLVLAIIGQQIAGLREARKPACANWGTEPSCVVLVASLRLRLLFALPALPARVRAFVCVCGRCLFC